MLEKREYYRFPWSMNDNPIAWLEVTDICNIHCEGCYRQHMTGHKSLEEVKEEVMFFKRWRNPDNVSIAGGEPLIYPHIVELVRFISEQGIKPIILTNGVALTPEYLHELKQAGLVGFTMHVDSHQSRPHWNGKNERELNELRQHFADMVQKEGGIYLVFNSTIYPSTYHEIPDIVEWGQQNIDKVQGLVFITYRTAAASTTTGIDVHDQEIDMHRLGYTSETFDEKFVTSPEVHDIIQENFPEYEASGYLGGTIRHDSFKWLIGAMIGSKKRYYGSIGKKTMEIAQAGHHYFKGTYLAYLSKSSIGRSIYWMAPFDSQVKKARNRWYADILRHPLRLFEPVYLQSIGIIQAPDVQPDGRADMCDSCPDITIYDGKFINSCRMDEYRLFDGFITLKEKGLEKEREKERV